MGFEIKSHHHFYMYMCIYACVMWGEEERKMKDYTKAIPAMSFCSYKKQNNKQMIIAIFFHFEPVRTKDCFSTNQYRILNYLHCKYLCKNDVFILL